MTLVKNQLHRFRALTQDGFVLSPGAVYLWGVFMKLVLLVVVFWSATELLGARFRYNGALQSMSFQLLSSRLIPTGAYPARIDLFKGVGEQEDVWIYAYSIFVRAPEAEPNSAKILQIAKWMIDNSTSDIFRAYGNSKMEVIGERLGTVSEDNPLGTPFVIETETTKLIVDAQYEIKDVILTVSGQKALEDGQIMTWEDTLGYKQ